jgi:hypothetical protein
LLFGDAAKQEAELLFLVRIESAANGGIVFARNPTDLLHHFSAGCR